MRGAIIHCSDSPQGRGDNAKTIHRWHQQRGWDGIGYHYVILEDGTIENGRPLYWEGSHAKGFNNYIGICLIGKDTFTMKQMEELSNLLVKLAKDDKIDPEKILGHYEVSTKTCPNFDVKPIAKVVKERVKYDNI